MSIGVSSNRIVYANPCKQMNYIKFASQVGADLMTFDNDNELRKIKACFPDARYVNSCLSLGIKMVILLTSAMWYQIIS